MNYYIFFQDQRLGPYTFDDLIALKLPKSTPIWTDGMTDWSTIEALNFEADSPNSSNSNQNSTENTFTDNSFTENTFTDNTFTDNTFTDNTFRESKESKKNNSFIRAALLTAVSLLLILGVSYFISSNHNSGEVNTMDSLAGDSPLVLEQPEESPKQNNESSNSKQDSEVVTKDETLYYRENWPDLITSSNNAFLYSDLGGISNLEISINNNTPYKLDEVTVIVEYIKTNGGVFKTETLYFNDIEPNSISSLSAPDSPRGTSVNHYIIGVQSTGMKLHYPH